MSSFSNLLRAINMFNFSNSWAFPWPSVERTNTTHIIQHIFQNYKDILEVIWISLCMFLLHNFMFELSIWLIKIKVWAKNVLLIPPATNLSPPIRPTACPAKKIVEVNHNEWETFESYLIYMRWFQLMLWTFEEAKQASPETSFTKPKPICYCFRPIRIQNLRFNPIRAFVLFLINGSGDPLSLIFSQMDHICWASL